MRVFLPLVVSALSAVAQAIEPWADKNLPVREGLALWLDAGAEPAAQRAAGGKSEKDDIAPGVWHDGSGDQRDARQEQAEAQPRLATAWPAKLFAFDGTARHFTVQADGLALKEAKVLVLARATANPGGFRGLVAAGKTATNDYVSGFNLDLGSQAADGDLTALNFEGAGFRGERNLLRDAVPFGKTFSAAAVIGAEQVALTVALGAPRPFTFTLGDKTTASQPKGARHEAAHTVTTKTGTGLALNVAFPTASGDPALSAHWFTDRSATPRTFPLRRVLLPSAQPQEAPAIPRNEDLPQLAGANWNHGATLFKSLCATCHAIPGEGGKVGPELSNLLYRDYDSVLRDIREPNAAINPEHVADTVTKKSGEEKIAVRSGESAGIVSLALPAGQILEIPRAEIAAMQQLAISLMPPGLDQALSPEQLRDLMSYLLLPPLEPAPLVLPGAPPPRKMSEVKAIVGDALMTPPDAKAKPLRIVLCASEKDKGHAKPGLHDYALWRARWSRLLGMADGITVEQAHDWPSAEQWQTADVIAIKSHNPAWSAERDLAKVAALAQQMDAFLARGGGFVSIHWSVNAGPNTGALAQRLGLAWGKGAKYRRGATDWVLDKNHPLAAGFNDFLIPEESYWHLGGDLNAAQARVLATSLEEAEPRPQMWTREVGPGRVFVSIPGHFTWTHDDPLYRILILRSLMWSARQPLDRLAPLSVIGARVEN